MKKRMIILAILLLIICTFFILYLTYPKGIPINKEKKISQIPVQWKTIPLGIKRNQLFSILGSSLNATTTWPEKADVWIKHDKKGWYRLNVFSNTDSTIRGYSIDYYYGNEENYKFLQLTHTGSW